MEHLNKVLEEIGELQKAKELLDRIWVELGSYDNGISQELQIELDRFYDIDDSE